MRITIERLKEDVKVGKTDSKYSSINVKVDDFGVRKGNVPQTLFDLLEKELKKELGAGFRADLGRLVYTQTNVDKTGGQTERSNNYDYYKRNFDLSDVSTYMSSGDPFSSSPSGGYIQIDLRCDFVME